MIQYWICLQHQNCQFILTCSLSCCSYYISYYYYYCYFHLRSCVVKQAYGELHYLGRWRSPATYSDILFFGCHLSKSKLLHTIRIFSLNNTHITLCNMFYHLQTSPDLSAKNCVSVLGVLQKYCFVLAIYCCAAIWGHVSCLFIHFSESSQQNSVYLVHNEDHLDQTGLCVFNNGCQWDRLLFLTDVWVSPALFNAFCVLTWEKISRNKIYILLFVPLWPWPQEQVGSENACIRINCEISTLARNLACVGWLVGCLLLMAASSGCCS